jgi:hypothetical protein
LLHPAHRLLLPGKWLRLTIVELAVPVPEELQMFPGTRSKGLLIVSFEYNLGYSYCDSTIQKY